MDSMEQIYKKHAQTIYGFLLSRTNQAELAQELTQETFYQAMRSIHRFKGNCSVSTWLCAIAKNVWKTYLQKHNKEECMEEVEVGTTCSAEQEVLVNWDKVEILKVLHRLEDPIREVMYLRLIANLSFREIGEIMDRTENWARVNYYRGKEKIVQEVKKS
jgi:RNA polymerase sigma-70 factor (ECF subfamily)